MSIKDMVARYPIEEANWRPLENLYIGTGKVLEYPIEDSQASYDLHVRFAWMRRAVRMMDSRPHLHKGRKP